MNVRSDKVSDAKGICSLINYYAERDKMLFRSLADIYENLQTFTVAEQEMNIERRTANPSAALRTSFDIPSWIFGILIGSLSITLTAFFLGRFDQI